MRLTDCLTLTAETDEAEITPSVILNWNGKPIATIDQFVLKSGEAGKFIRRTIGPTLLSNNQTCSGMLLSFISI